MRQRPRAWAAVIVAAGRGTRFGCPKQLIEIAGEPMLSWPVRTFAAMEEIARIVVVTEEAWLDEVTRVVQFAAGSKLQAVVIGGPTRQSSTYRGLASIPQECDGVFVHDGARPLVTAGDVRAGMELVCPGHGSLLAVPIVDTIKGVDPQTHRVLETLDRRMLWAAQTPQFATSADMLSAHEAGIREDIDATDDAMLLERAGISVHAVSGSVENFKVTIREDQVRADRVMRARLAAAAEVP